jgi:hypothetical protein
MNPIRPRQQSKCLLLALPLTALVLALLLALTTAPALAAEGDAEAAFEKSREAFMAAESGAEQVAAATDFLSRYPDSPYTARVLRAGTNVMANELGDLPGAIALSRRAIARMSNPEHIREARKVQLDLFSRPGYEEQLVEVIAAMADQGDLSFVDHLEVIRAATAAEAWSLVIEITDSAMPLANAETFAADYPDRDFSEDYIKEAGRNRRGLVETYRGWALTNQGLTAGAVTAFAMAEVNLRPTYLGVPDNELNRYWGEALYRQGEYQAALETLLPAAVWAADEEALALARKAYAHQHGSDAGFAAMLEEYRQTNARKIDDFTLEDYAGQARSFSDLHGEVTLLAFWFPT